MTGPLAHAGHWLVNLAYVAPLILLVGVVCWGKFKERRIERRGRPAEPNGA